MALLRWAPFDLATESIDDVVRRTFGNFGGDFGSSLLANRTGWAPALDVSVEGEELHVRLELPGIDPESDVDIEVENGVLRVSGERRDESKREGDGFIRSEMRYGSFDRRIALPEGVDAGSVRASYDAGILHIAIPMPAKPKTKVKVAVNGAKQIEG